MKNECERMKNGMRISEKITRRMKSMDKIKN